MSGRTPAGPARGCTDKNGFELVDEGWGGGGWGYVNSSHCSYSLIFSSLRPSALYETSL